VDTAVAAARRAFEDGPWPKMKPTEVGKMIVQAAAGNLKKVSLELDALQ
jgi:acyl-CoA reductase-like NAD-dependent aldehyde dehydrogenase